MSVGENIKKYRKYKKMTQQQLAEMIGKSIDTIKKYEGEKTTPPLPVIKNIATALAVPVSAFLDIDDNIENNDNCDFKKLPVLDNEEFILKQQLLNYLENYHNLKAAPALSLCDEIMDYIKMRIEHFKNKEGE